MHQILDKISTKILRIIPLVLALVVPLFFLPTTADYFAFNKYFFIAAVGTISLLAWGVRNLTRGKLHFTASPSMLPLVILVLANIVSSVWISQTKHVSLFGQTSLFFFLVIIFITITSSQKNRFTVNSGIYGLIISASALSLFTLFQYFGIWSKLFPSSQLLTNKLFNPTGGVLPAITFSIPILVATIFYTTKINDWIVKSSLFASVLLMIIATVINISLLLPQNGLPSISILPFDAGWSIAVDTFKTWQTALFGTGPETFFNAFARLRPAYLNLDKNIWTIRFSESSNFFFTLLTTTGLIGALAFIYSFIKPLLGSVKYKSTVEEKGAYNFLLTTLSLVIISFFAVPTGVVSLNLGIVTLICLTILMKLENFKSVKDINISLAADSPDSPVYNDLPATARTRVLTAFLPWLVIFISVALLSTFWFFASKMYAASSAFNEATKLVQADPYSSYLKYQKAAELDIYNPYYPQKFSQIYLAIAKAYLTKKDPTEADKKSGTEFAQRAIDAGKISAKLDPQNVTAWENLFNIYSSLIPYAQGSSDMAISHGLQSATLNPTNPVIYLQLGILFYNLGDTDQAIKFISRASELKQNWDLPYYNLSSIYKAKKEYAKALQYSQAGVQYTDPKSQDLPTIQAEIASLQKMISPSTATQSAIIN